jgi:hypothetical protein
MSEKFEVRAGQTWRIEDENGNDVLLTIIDMYVADPLGEKENFSLYFVVDRKFGDGETKRGELFADLHLRLAKGWTLVE